MSDIENTINYSKKIETLLQKNFDAEGKGLHEKVTSVEPILPLDIIKKLRRIATIRNKLVHEDGYELHNSELLFNDCESVIESLHKTKKTCNSPSSKFDNEKYNKLINQTALILFLATAFYAFVIWDFFSITGKYQGYFFISFSNMKNNSQYETVQFLITMLYGVIVLGPYFYTKYKIGCAQVLIDNLKSGTSIWDEIFGKYSIYIFIVGLAIILAWHIKQDFFG